MADAYKTMLKRKFNGKEVKTYPYTLAELVFMSKGTDEAGNKIDLKSTIQAIENKITEIESSVHFKGAFDSLNALKSAVPNPVWGDYAIIKRVDENDFFVVYDEDASGWREEGGVIESIVKSVNGQTGDVVINGANLKAKYGALAEEKTLNEILTDFNNQISENQENIEDIEARTQTIELSYLRNKGVWAAGTAYKKNDIVSVNGSKNIYVCIQYTASSISPVQNVENWQIFVKGASDDLVTKEDLEEALSAIPTPDVSGQIDTHNEDENAHPYILGLLPTVTNLG